MARTVLLTTLALAAAGCDLLSPGVTGVLIEEVQVERLDLSQPWDNPFTGDKPDVYADVFVADGRFELGPDGRSPRVENLDADDLPRGFPMPEPVRVDFGETVTVTVSDHDGPGTDDQMFNTGPFTVEDGPEAEAGARGGRTFDTEQGRVVVVFRYD